MTYLDLPTLAEDADFRARCIGCAALEGNPAPEQWQYANKYAMAASPGFLAAYSSALVAEVPRPGADPAVISDNQILAAYQALTG